MPKKNTAARGGAQRNKPRVQKSFELVRDTPVQVSDEQEIETEASSNSAEAGEAAAVSVSTIVTPEPKKTASTATKPAPTAKKSENAETKFLTETPAAATESVNTATAPKGSAAAKLAARRQAGQKAQQRAAATLITAEHYAYVRRDLITIAILAAIMFSTMIILYFVMPGIGL